jgi:hypothetical protein
VQRLKTFSINLGKSIQSPELPESSHYPIPNVGMSNSRPIVMPIVIGCWNSPLPALLNLGAACARTDLSLLGWSEIAFKVWLAG